MWTVCLFFLTISLLLAKNVSAVVDYIDAFEGMASEIVWPVPQSPRSLISSTFGPRVKASSQAYDFHRGIDIHGEIGEEVVACYPGKVEKVTTYQSGGLTVILRHDFDDNNVLFHSDKPLTGRFYTLHMHLDSTNATKGDLVDAGTYIGALGESGQTQNPHLHFEIRIGSRCSLEYALDNPSSKCNTYDYDPHIHPMLIFEDLDPSVHVPSLSVTTDVTHNTDGVIRVETDDVQPNINMYRIEIIDTLQQNAIRDFWLLDLNRRTGFDATSNAALDIPDTNKPFLNPISFGYSTSTWKMEFIIPYCWVGTKAVGEVFRVIVTDVWGRNTHIDFGDANASW